VLGTHRSGTSAATRLISLLGLETPSGDDLVPPSRKNPKGYWESMSLVAFNIRLLEAIGSDFTCPVPLAPGWHEDARLDSFRDRAPDVFRDAFPVAPWVWKDPRTCLTFSFWRASLPVRPVVVLVNRNPFEVAASAARTRGDTRRTYLIAQWERYLREGLWQIGGLPVLVTGYEQLLEQPLDWCDVVRSFLSGCGLPVHEQRAEDVLSFVDVQLRHAQFTRSDVLDSLEISPAQRQLFLTLEELQGDHREFSPPRLPPETATTEALLMERRRTRQIERELEQERRSRPLARIRRSRYLTPLAHAYAGVRRRSG